MLQVLGDGAEEECGVHFKEKVPFGSFSQKTFGKDPVQDRPIFLDAIKELLQCGLQHLLAVTQLVDSVNSDCPAPLLNASLCYLTEMLPLLLISFAPVKNLSSSGVSKSRLLVKTFTDREKWARSKSRAEKKMIFMLAKRSESQRAALANAKRCGRRESGQRNAKIRLPFNKSLLGFLDKNWLTFNALHGGTNSRNQ